MNALLIKALLPLLAMIAPALGELIVAFLKRLTAEIASGEQLDRFTLTARQIVADQIRLAPPGTSAGLMRERAAAAIHLFAAEMGTPVSRETVAAFVGLIPIEEG